MACTRTTGNSFDFINSKPYGCDGSETLFAVKNFKHEKYGNF